MNPLMVIAVVAAAGMAAYAIASVIVEVADRLGLVYSPTREERRHVGDLWQAADMNPDPDRFVPVTAARTAELDLAEAIERRLAMPDPPPQPIRRRVLARRVALALGGTR